MAVDLSFVESIPGNGARCTDYGSIGTGVSLGDPVRRLTDVECIWKCASVPLPYRSISTEY